MSPKNSEEGRGSILESEDPRAPTRERRQSLGPAELLQETLSGFRSRVDGVVGIAVADKSGLPVASAFAHRANVLTVTAMATMAVQSSQRVYQNLGLTGPSEVVMVGPDSTVFVYAANEGQLSIIAVLSAYANLGLVRIEIERLSREIAEILGI